MLCDSHMNTMLRGARVRSGVNIVRCPIRVLRLQK
jgi:hypothetical protein